LFHPDTPSNNGVVPAQESFLASKFVFTSHSMAFYNDLWRRGITLNPSVLPRVMPLISSDDTKPIYHMTSQIIGTTALKKAPTERIKELLGIRVLGIYDVFFFCAGQPEAVRREFLEAMGFDGEAAPTETRAAVLSGV
jgi:hypothetical protein